MKLERINDNQIRCTLTGMDLQSLNINVFELAYGSEKTQNLFKEMLSRASRELGFHTEDYPLMVEAIPTSPDSIVIIITKVDDPDELDSRFAKFAPLHEDLLSSSLDEIPGYEPLEGVQSILPDKAPRSASGKASLAPSEGDGNSTASGEEGMDKGQEEDKRQEIPESVDELAKAFIAKARKEAPELFSDGADDAKNETETEEAGSEEGSSEGISSDAGQRDYKIFCFDSLDRIVDAARVISRDARVSSTLYKNSQANRYYLVLSDPAGENRGFTNICNLLSEYGQKVAPHYLSIRYYEEHFETLIKKRTLENLTLL